MVYGGKPSTGCYLCRKRKIKCDEALPQCRNCIVYGKPCPGYRPDAIFRNETQKVERLVKRINNSPESQAPDSSSGSSAGSSSREVSPRSGTSMSSRQGSGSPLTVYRIEDATWDDRAICYFFDQYTTYGETDESVTHLGFLPALYAVCKESSGQDGPASSCLRQAVEATALLAMGNEVRSQALTVKARNSYGMALRGLRHALSTRAQAVKDETFTAVALLSIFEDITGERHGRNGLCSSHTEGFQLLMRLRGEEQLTHQRGRDLFNFAYTHTHIEILALGDKPRFNTDWIVGFLNDSDPVHRLVVTSSKITELLIAASAAARTGHVEGDIFAQINEWIESGKVLDKELAEWSQTLPESWLPLFVTSQTGEPLMTYRRISIGAIWNFYRALRVVTHRILLDTRGILTALIELFTGEKNSEAAQEEAISLQIIQEMITGVCQSIPFSLGDVDTFGKPTRESRMRAFHGYTLLWPLWFVLVCGLATPDQIEQVRGVMAHVGSVLGIKLASILAENPYIMPEMQSQLALPMEYPIDITKFLF